MCVIFPLLMAEMEIGVVIASSLRKKREFRGRSGAIYEGFIYLMSPANSTR